MTATVEALTATSHLQIVPPRVSGVVREPVADRGAPVSGVQVRIDGGTLTGQIVVTDAQGRFTLPPVTAAGFSLEFQKAGYNETRFSVTDLAQAQQIEIQLTPLPPIAQHWNGTLERRDIPGPPTGFTNVLVGWPGDVIFETHRSDQATMQFDMGCIAWGTYTDVGFDVVSVATGVRVGAIWAYSAHSTSSFDLPPDRYRLSGGANGYLGSSCLWSLTLSRAQ